jgi:hypothetical protein
MDTKRERNRLAQQQRRARHNLLRQERKRAAKLDDGGWPLLEAFKAAAPKNKRAVIRASLQTWRRG